MIQEIAKTKMKNLKLELTKIIKEALTEDCALSDITSDLTIPQNHQISFSIRPREKIILCGIDVIKICFATLKKSEKFADAKIKLEILAKDSDIVKPTKSIASGHGDAKLIFAAERVILNLLQHLSGISTLTNQFVTSLKNPKIKILDTRKTIPNLRNIEKYAVKIGGGENHRFNLSDMILIKDNHIEAAGGIEKAILAAKKSTKKIEIECDNLTQVAQAAKLNPHVIMLDNMNERQIKEAIKIINKKCLIEISGGINLKNIKSFRKFDVDFISVGALTHSAKAVDIGLDIK